MSEPRVEEIKQRFGDDPSSDNVFDATDIAILLAALEHAERALAEAQKCAATTFNGACYWRDTVVPDLRTRLAEAEQQRDHFRSLLKAP